MFGGQAPSKPQAAIEGRVTIAGKDYPDFGTYAPLALGRTRTSFCTDRFHHG